MSIVDTIYSYLPAKRKHTPSGWTKFNAVCCSHNGNTPDNRQRGGIIKNPEGVSYHCFNCGFKASYVAGRHITRKMRQLLSWMGANDDVISKLSLEALKIESDQKELEAVSLPTLPDKELPADTQTLERALMSNPEAVIGVADYILSRGFDIRADWMWSPELPDRVIIPFRYEGRIVGYTARKITDGKPKYLSEQTPGYVFNLDAQANDRPVVLAVEGPMDALSIDGIALLGAEIMAKQAMLINRLGKKVILIPDRDNDGARTVEQAIELGWSVSMPDWGPGIKDCNDAIRTYGQLYTIMLIMSAVETTELKIRLRAKQWFKEQKEE
jgi:hypothetical protein